MVASYASHDLFRRALVRSYVETAHFVERPWLLERVQRCVEEEGCRFILLTGPPGLGKTAFMGWLAHTHPSWIRYFIRPDSTTLLESADARSFLLSVGHQLATLHPIAFEPDRLAVTVKQRVGTVLPGGKLSGITIQDLYVSPFFRNAMTVEQEVDELAGQLEGIRIARMIGEDRLLDLEVLQHLALLGPAEVLATEEPSTRLIILIDALDEVRQFAGQISILTWLSNCPELPPNVCIIISSRNESLLDTFKVRQQRWLRVEAIDTDAQEIRADLRIYAAAFTRDETFSRALRHRKTSDAEFIGLVTEKAAGNFQYIATLLRAIKLSIDAGDEEKADRLLNLQELPSDLENLYAFFLTLVKDGVGRASIEISTIPSSPRVYLPAWDALYRPLLGVLSVARAPLDRAQIKQFARIRASDSWLLGGLESLGQFLDREDGAYSLYHVTFAEFLTHQNTRLAHPYFYFNPVEWHGNIADFYLSTPLSHETTPDLYGLLHLPAHLLGAQHYKELNDLAESRAWYMAKRQLDPSLQRYADDVSLALIHAESPANLDIPRVISYNLLLAMVRSLTEQASNPPISGLIALILLGRSSEALSQVLLVADHRYRLWALEKLTETLAARQMSKACLAFADHSLRQVLKLDKSLLTHIRRQGADDIEDALKDVDEAYRATPVQNIVELFAELTSLDPTYSNEHADRLEEIRRINIMCIPLPALSKKTQTAMLASSLRFLMDLVLISVDFPMGQDRASSHEDLKLIDILFEQPYVAALAIPDIDLDLVRSSAAGALAAQGNLTSALEVTSKCGHLIAQFKTLAAAIIHLAEARKPELVRKVWVQFQSIDDGRFVGAKFARTRMLVSVASALKKIGKNELHNRAMMKALTLHLRSEHPLRKEAAELPALEERTSDKIDALCALVERLIASAREAVENGRDDAHVPFEIARKFLQDAEGLVLAENDVAERVKGVAALRSVLADIGEQTKALESWNLTLEAANAAATPNAFAAVAEALAREGDVEGAEQFLEKATAPLIGGRLGSIPRESWAVRAEMLVRSNQLNAAIALANEDAVNRAQVLAAVASVRAESGDDISDLAERALLNTNEPEVAFRVAIAFKSAGVDAKSAEALGRAIELAQAIQSNTSRLETLISATHRLGENGMTRDVIRLCEGSDDLLTRCGLVAGLFRALVKSATSDDDYLNGISWAVDMLNVMQTMMAVTRARSLELTPEWPYPVPIALLTMAKAVQERGDAKLAQAWGIPSFVEIFEALAFIALSKRAKPEGRIGTFRVLNALRIAAGLSEFPKGFVQLTAAGGSTREVWQLLCSEAKRRAFDGASLTGFVASIKEAREAGWRAMWSAIGNAQRFLYNHGRTSETLERIRAVEAILSMHT
jgi:hypothetical protein